MTWVLLVLAASGRLFLVEMDDRTECLTRTTEALEMLLDRGEVPLTWSCGRSYDA